MFVLRSSVVEVWQERTCVARHERCYVRYRQVLNLEHYLAVLEKKPGAFSGSTPLKQWRECGRWPPSYDVLWRSLETRYGRWEGTREMIGLLQLGPQHGWTQLRQAIEKALELGCSDAAAVRHLLSSEGLKHTRSCGFDLGELQRYERPLPTLRNYDLLLATNPEVV